MKIMRKFGCGETLRNNNEVTVRRSSWIIHLPFMMMARVEAKKRTKKMYWRRKTLASLWNQISFPRR